MQQELQFSLCQTVWGVDGNLFCGKFPLTPLDFNETFCEMQLIFLRLIE